MTGDMEEQNNEIILTDDELRELRDVRAAMLKQRHGQVDVDAAWRAFCKEMSSKKQNHESQQLSLGKNSQRVSNTARWLYMFYGTIIGVAASLLCFIISRSKLLPTTIDDNGMLVSEFVEQKENDVEMITSINGESSRIDVHHSTYHVKGTDDGLLDFRKKNLSDAVEERIITTPRGKIQTIILADGSKVLLNNESSLRFPTRFTGDTRSVYVEGEAYFTVAKDTAHPFIVHSRNISTTALGTCFNVEAYKGKTIRITLVDGSVKVASGSRHEIILKPGEEVNVLNDKLLITDADTKTYRQWEEGYFYYDNVPLIDVLTELGRWYNVNIELQNRRLMSYRLHFVADRNTSIDEALERLNEFQYLHAERQGDKIIVCENKMKH